YEITDFWSTGTGTDVTTYDPDTGLLVMQDGADKFEMNVLDALDLEFMSFTDPDDPTVTWKVLADFDNTSPSNSNFKLWYASSGAAANTVGVFNTSGTTGGESLYFNEDGTFRSYENVIGNPSFTLDDGANTLNVFLNASNNGRALEIHASDDQTTLDPAAQPVADVLATLTQRLDSVHDSKVDIYDSLGNAHTLEVSWEKLELSTSGLGQWRWRAWLPGEEDANIPLSPNAGIITFDANGELKGTDVFDLELGFSAIGAEDETVQLDFSGRSFDKEPIEGVTQFGSAFTTKAYYQDGYAMGVLEDYSVGTDGVITGVYSNEQRRSLATIALSVFANPEGLQKVGDTAFRTTSNSGLAQIVAPQSGGAGKILGGNLEMSNVDLSEEFITLIKAQRGFQANARTVTTSDSVLEELVNIKR
nr:flagellar hook-basal body complex protein [Synergistaceae bacterium]